MISPTNRLLIWTAVAAPIAIVASTVPAARLWVWIYLAVILLVAGMDALTALTRCSALKVRYVGITRLSKGREGDIRLCIERRAPGTLAIEIGLPLPMEIESPSETLPVTLEGESLSFHVDWHCECSTRGRYTLEHTYYTTRSRFGFWVARGETQSEGDIRVYPNLLKDRSQAALFLRSQNIGIHNVRMTGQGREFDQLRSYMPGDDYTNIDWKATARRGQPVTRLFQMERTQKVYAFIDLSRLSARAINGQPVLEEYLTAALTLGMAAEQQGDHFGLVTFSDKVHTFIRAGRGKAHYDACREAIYTAASSKVNPDFDQLFTFIRLQLRRRALLVFLTDLRDPVFAETFSEACQMVSRHHLMVVNMVRPEGVRRLFSHEDISSRADMVRQLAGHVVWQNMAELEKQLKIQGVDMSMCEASGLTTDIITRYMRIKRRQLL